MIHPRNLWPLLVGMALLLACGCGAPKSDNDLVSERLGSIDNHLSDISASLKNIADRPRILPLGEKEPK